MNAKELEALVKDQGSAIAGLQARLLEMTEARDKAVIAADEHRANVLGVVRELNEAVTNLTTLIGADEGDGPLYPEFKGIKSMLEDISAKVEGRNKSAPTKRNMTDADALAVLTGEHKELSHKEAAEKIGLTYAQVYSARLEFTFKHVHKELRDAKWVNPWAK